MTLVNSLSDETSLSVEQTRLRADVRRFANMRQCPVASDSRDESRINRAEARAAKKKKAKSTKSFKPSATVTSGSLPRGGNKFSFPVQQQRPKPMQQLHTFRPHYFKGNARGKVGPCFA
ncbi:hypothetical protein DPMN_182436 [Dreissena polymorpha]|uniref:Uncharacterized protein n=1 Tax=Dreissena polymorpha TaxID=45954 RepID=A0A9D4I4N1_DREPO|nr:hypothetical protein DPMN_182436 [Dreissena polymorpha]